MVKKVDPRPNLERTPSVRFVREVLGRVQRYKGWRRLWFGYCGSASIAINEVLMGSEGKYLIQITRGVRGGFPSKWRGHVAMLYKGTVFDYEGAMSFESFAFWHLETGEKPLLIVDAPKKEVVRRFVRPAMGSEAFEDRARELLRRAIKAERAKRRK